MNKEIFIECDCYSEGIKLNYQDELLYISLYQRGFKPRTKTIKEKLRWIWQIIIKDVPYDDELIISKDKIKQLSQFVNEILPNNTQFVNENRPNNIELKRGTLYKMQGEDMPFRYVEYSGLVNAKNNGLYHFKYHQLKNITLSKANLDRVEREATSEEIRIYNLTKKEADKLWKEQNSRNYNFY